MTLNELLIEKAQRLARLAADGVKQCEKLSAMLDSKPLSVDDELKKVEAAFWEDQPCKRRVPNSREVS